MKVPLYQHIPFEQKIKIYREVLKLVKNGLSTKRIQDVIVKKFKAIMNEETIRLWKQFKHSPFGNVKLLNNEPVSLAYVTGAILADGSTNYDKKRNDYRVYLLSKDNDFLNEFENNCKCLGLSVIKTHLRQYPIRIAKNRELYYFVTQKWKSFIVKSNKRVISTFLKGFFDGDGTALFPGYVNTNLTLLRMTKKLLNKLGIKSSPPILTTPQSKKFFYSDKAQLVKTKSCYTIFVHPFYYKKFLKNIGTSIKRKEHLIYLSIDRLKQEKFPKNVKWWKVCEKLARSIGNKIKKRNSDFI